MICIPNYLHEKLSLILDQTCIPHDPNMNIKIRAAELNDAKHLSKLIQENAIVILSEFYTDEQMKAFLEYYNTSRMQERIINQNVFCAVQEDVIVGTIALDNEFLVGFYTRIENLRQGIGHLMMTFVEEYAKSKGLTELFLTSSPFAEKFYLKNGWTSIKAEVYQYCGVDFAETLMSKKI